MERIKEYEAAADFFNSVLDELSYAESKHNGFPTDRIHASAILNEEAGKLTQACIDFEYGKTAGEEGNKNMARYAARVAAMALRFYQSQPK
jgi:hypothetical protein